MEQNEEMQAEIDSVEDLIEEEPNDENAVIKLDYTIESPAERNELVKKIIEHTPPEKLTHKYLEILTDYIIFAMDKEERKQRKILTDNRMVTVNKRETSYEGLVGKLENGEDGIYNMIANDKNIIFAPKKKITEEEIAEMPPLKELVTAIDNVEKQCKAATGRKKFLLKKQLIEMHQDQYEIRKVYHQPMYCTNSVKSFSKIDLSEHIIINSEGKVESDCLISIFDPKHISAVLCNYSKIKEDSYAKFKSDSYYFMEDLDDLINNTLKEKHPLLFDLLVYKIDGMQNVDIQAALFEKYGIRYSVEYISSLWRNKIPKLLAEKAEEDYLIWYYTEKEKGYWKKCSRCGQIKLGHNRFFSKNKTSKDGWYSICKCCRNAKK